MPQGYATCTIRYWTAATNSESISAKRTVCQRGI